MPAPKVDLPKIIIEWAKKNPVAAATVLGATAPTTAAVGVNAIQGMNAANPPLNMVPLRGTQTEAALKTKTPIEIAQMVQGMRQPQQIAPPPVPPLPQQPTQSAPQGGKFWEWFKQYGVPLAAVGIGASSDTALPAATGFASGYVPERQRQQQEAEKNAQRGKEVPVYIFDEELGKVVDSDGKVVNKVPSDAVIKTKSQASAGWSGLPPNLGGGAPQLPGSATTASRAAKTLISEDMVNQYMQQYPDRTREEIIAAIERQNQ